MAIGGTSGIGNVLAGGYARRGFDVVIAGAGAARYPPATEAGALPRPGVCAP